jgi:hypothetical protein
MVMASSGEDREAVRPGSDFPSVAIGSGWRGHCTHLTGSETRSGSCEATPAGEPVQFCVTKCDKMGVRSVCK